MATTLHAAPSDPDDPFDVEALRAAPPSATVSEHVVVTVAARRPNKNEFFRVHPDPKFIIDGTIVEFEGPDGRLDYWLPPAMRSAAPEELRAVRVFRCLNKAGVTFLWPARLPSADNMAGRSWHESGLAIAEIAKVSWTKMAGNRAAGAYEAHRATGDLGTPHWSDHTMGELLKLAFGGERLIDSPDHPVLQSLRGEL